jgi:hypothetical protein
LARIKKNNDPESDDWRVINAICLFRKGITPAWEDPINAKGSEFRVLLENFRDSNEDDGF